MMGRLHDATLGGTFATDRRAGMRATVPQDAVFAVH